jgi:hypothetical protein
MLVLNLRNILLLTAAGVLAFALTPSLSAQQNSSPSMSHRHSAPQPMIDGEVHPELIPDESAYRLVFVVLGLPTNATDAEEQLRNLRLNDVGLSVSDAQAAAPVLDWFKVRYADMINTFNDSAHAISANGGTPDIQSFDVARDGLVQATRDQLKQMLSPPGMAALDGFVHREKAKMRVPAQ